MSNIAKGLKFEESFPYFSLNGAVCLVEGHNNDHPSFPGDAYTPCLIQCDQGFCLHVKWHVHGKMLPFLNGKWKINLLAEEWGCGETCLPDDCTETTVEWDCDGHYHAKICVPPNKMDAGLYKFAVCLTMCSTCPKEIPAPVAGFVELPAVKLYKA